MKETTIGGGKSASKGGNKRYSWRTQKVYNEVVVLFDPDAATVGDVVTDSRGRTYVAGGRQRMDGTWQHTGLRRVHHEDHDRV